MWLAAVFFAGAAWFYAQVVGAQRSHPWRPFSVRVSLSPGTITTPQFQVHFTGDYNVELEIQSKTDRQKLRSDPSLIDISWELLEGGKRVEIAPTVFSKGDSQEYSSVPTPPGSPFRQIGRFRGEKDHIYQLVMHVQKDASELNPGKPIVVTAVEPSAAKDYLVGTYIHADLAKILAVLAILVALLSIKWRFGHSFLQKFRPPRRCRSSGRFHAVL
jgi:hypothetical protein